MPTIGKSMFGAKGQDTKNSPFRLDPLRSQIAENFIVTSDSRRSRPQLQRWKYDKYCSNALRFIGTYKKSYVIFKDYDNLRYNMFGAGASGTIECRVRLHGAGGYSLMSSIPVVSREISGTGFTFALTLESVDSPTLERYNPKLVISDGSGTYTANFVNTKIRHGDWKTISIVKDVSNTRFRVLIDGVFSENITFAASGGATPAGAQSTFDTTRNDPTYSDVVIGASGLTTSGALFAPIDVDDVRLWTVARTDNQILNAYNSELDSSDQTGLIGHFEFQDNHDGHVCSDAVVANSRVLGFFGGSPPYNKSSESKLMFDGSTMYGKLNPVAGGGVTSQITNMWGSTQLGLLKVSEIAFTVLKVKQCRIAGPLQMYYDGGTGKYGVQILYKKNGVDSTLDSGGFIAASDINNTEYYIAIRQLPSTSVLELWVNGVKVANTSFTTSAARAGETGTNIGCGPTFASDFAAIKIKWLRTYDFELPDDYFQTKYNLEADDFKLNMYSHGTQTESWTAAATRSIQGNGTSLNNIFVTSAPANNAFYSSLKENKEQVGEDYQDQLVSLNTGAQSWTQIVASSTGDPWGAGFAQITNKEGYAITALATRYNANSWQNIKVDKDSFFQVAKTTSLVLGGYDRDKDPGYGMELYYRPINAIAKFVQLPSFIGGITRIINSKPCRYIGQFKTSNGLIDVIITIVGTALNVFDRVTKIQTQYPISIQPNGDQPFVGDFLDGGLYLTDGVTKIHIYSYKNQLRVVRWGFSQPLGRITPSGYVGAGGPWTANLQYQYAYYNREIDQFGSLPPQKSDFSTEQVNLSTNRAAQLDTIQPCPEFFEGVTDIAIFRTKDLLSTGILAQYYLYDFVKGNSQGAMDWSQTDARLSQRYPVELVGTDNGPGNGTFVASHNARLWMPDFDKIRFSRIGTELHNSVVKSETYLFPQDHYFVIPGNKPVTAAASYNDNTLAVFTIDTMDLISGVDISDFERRRIYTGVGCVAHRTLKKIGNALIWLGIDDLYVFLNGQPRSLDDEGKLSYFIKNNVDRTNLNKAFAVHNIENQLYELHLIDVLGFWRTILFDLRTGEYTISTDIRATDASVVLDDNNRPTVFYGLKEGGFIVKEALSGQNYQPTSGSVRTTVQSFSVDTITTVANDLQTTEGGLIGNFVYIVSPIGGILKAKIIANTANTIKLSLTEFEVVLSNVPFFPAAGYPVFIGPIFWHIKTAMIFSGTAQNQLQVQGNETTDPVAVELIGLSFIHPISPNTALMWVGLHRDGNNLLECLQQVNNLTDMNSIIRTNQEARAQFFDVEAWYLHESTPFDLVGMILQISLSEADYVS